MRHSSTHTILPPAWPDSWVPPRGQVVQTIAGVAVTWRTHITAPVLDAARRETETRARAQLALERRFVHIHYGYAIVYVPKEKRCQGHKQQTHCNQEGVPNCFVALRCSCLTLHRERCVIQ